MEGERRLRVRERDTKICGDREREIEVEIEKEMELERGECMSEIKFRRVEEMRDVNLR